MTKSKIAIIAGLTTMLVSGVSSAQAFDRQATDDALSYASVQAGFGGAASSVRAPTNAFASAQPGPGAGSRVRPSARSAAFKWIVSRRGLGE